MFLFFSADAIHNSLCLQLNGVSAIRQRCSGKLLVEQSMLESVAVKSIIIRINGRFVASMTNFEIQQCLATSKCDIEYESDIIRLCLAMNSVYAVKSNRTKICTVAESNVSVVPKKSVIFKINGQYASSMTESDVQSSLATSKCQIQYESEIIKQ